MPGFGPAFGFGRQGFFRADPFALNPGNLIAQPDDFTHAYWTKPEVTVTADQGVAPNGAMVMDLLVPSAVNGLHVLYSGVFAVTGPVWIELVTKPSGYSKFGIRESEATGAFATFSQSAVLDSGDAGGITITNETVVDLGDGSSRAKFLLTPPVPMNINIGIYGLPDAYAAGNPNDLGWAGDTVKGLLAWHAQAYHAS